MPARCLDGRRACCVQHRKLAGCGGCGRKSNAEAPVPDHGLTRLEQDLGVPVTSSSQSVIYGALRRLRIRDHIVGYGSLLASLAHDATRAPTFASV